MKSADENRPKKKDKNQTRFFHKTDPILLKPRHRDKSNTQNKKRKIRPSIIPKERSKEKPLDIIE